MSNDRKQMVKRWLGLDVSVGGKKQRITDTGSKASMELPFVSKKGCLVIACESM